jgi:hypothetical protein
MQNQFDNSVLQLPGEGFAVELGHDACLAA